MPTKIAINGFGRTGRMFFRAALHQPDLELVAVNDFDQPTGKGATGKVDGRSIMLGNARYLVFGPRSRTGFYLDRCKIPLVDVLRGYCASVFVSRLPCGESKALAYIVCGNLASRRRRANEAQSHQAHLRQSRC